ncbi:hypothetical protein D0962_34510 [Leptolyngbyaceae cyanobacterium CCMR0082]|uniref:Uncharacterized protein n=1 Tax=Adonisia turfae CCMR0082 TaxID=2304604 RepID=A0A6M0SIL5_9CYAN|nr:hypothetical protein [Adonisia turfae]NEZ67811.1 hypothetical protein [Adonisia turfae CCMR0082]
MVRKRGQIVKNKSVAKPVKAASVPTTEFQSDAIEIDTPADKVTDVAQGVVNQATADADSLSQLQVNVFTSRLVENMPTVIDSMGAATSAIFGGLRSAMDQACAVEIENVVNRPPLDLDSEPSMYLPESESDEDTTNGEGQA